MIRQDLLHGPGVNKINILDELSGQIRVEFAYAKPALAGVSAQGMACANVVIHPARGIDQGGWTGSARAVARGEGRSSDPMAAMAPP